VEPDQAPDVTDYHCILNRNQWSGPQIARYLLHLLDETFNPPGPCSSGSMTRYPPDTDQRPGSRIAGFRLA